MTKSNTELTTVGGDSTEQSPVEQLDAERTAAEQHEVRQPTIEDEKTELSAADLSSLTADIVSAYVRANAMPVDALPDLIASVNSALRGIVQPFSTEEPDLVPAVSRKRSVFPDYIVCLEDGRKLKSLKRHLRTHFNLTPDEYRAKWGLSADYPMVAANYAAHRSVIAKSVGLGRKTAGRKSSAKKQG
ncbi:MucR family transcriptional regulator [Mesorhizobium sp.]|uniref:MucR family transcriptional regulator n=1 Tax=Mesorhizobium sp. TaxID=1871066 RepID=UPI00344F9835